MKLDPNMCNVKIAVIDFCSIKFHLINGQAKYLNCCNRMTNHKRNKKILET